MISGVYLITCIASGRVYVGSTRDWNSREKSHRYALGRGDHHCRHLQNAWLKHGSANFLFELLEQTTIDELTTREQFYIDAGVGPGLMNGSTRASHPVLTAEGLEKMTQACVKAWVSEERRKQQSIKMKAAWARDSARRKQLSERNATYWSKERKSAHGDRVRSAPGHTERQEELRAHMVAFWTDDRRKQHSKLKSTQPRVNGRFVCQS